MLITYPNEILLTPSTDVDVKEGQEIAELLRKEILSLTWGSCVGLAAPQIGLNKNVFIALKKVYFNPKIIWYSPEKQILSEGCFSLEKNKYDYKVERHDKIKLSWMNFMGKQREEFFSGFEAEVIQHEYDHLLGKLCCGE